MLALARRRPGTLCIGLDAHAPSMADSSRRARRAGLANALFVVSAVESPPDPLHAIADEITVQFPWGSLLNGVLGCDASVLAGLACMTRPGGSVTVVLNDVEPGELRGVAERYAEHGLRVVDVSPGQATTSWGKRLGAGERRRVTVVRAIRT